MPGGWELWFHSELYVALVRADLVPLSEDKSYGDGRRADLAFLGEDGVLGIELKCESFWNKDKFAGEVSKDAKKLPDWHGDAVVQLCISVSDETTHEAPHRMREYGLKPESEEVAQSGRFKFTLHYTTIVRREEGL